MHDADLVSTELAHNFKFFFVEFSNFIFLIIFPLKTLLSNKYAKENPEITYKSRDLNF